MLKRVCFANTFNFKSIAQIKIKACTKSQLDVCGAPTKINFFKFGISPSTFQPEIFCRVLPNHCKNFDLLAR